jgi:hypothetical protein
MGAQIFWGNALASAMDVPKSACDDLLSQLTAGDEVSGIVTRWMMRVRNRSDEGDVTRFRRVDGGSSVHVRGRKTVIWSETGGMMGLSHGSLPTARVHGPKVQMRIGRCVLWLRRDSRTEASVEPVKGV